MEQHHNLNTTLHLLTQPAFLVDQGLITAVNASAAARLLQPGQQFVELLVTGSEEYESFTEGSLYVTLALNGMTQDACVIRMDGGDLVAVEPAQSHEALQALDLAATKLRKHLSDLMFTAEQFLPVAAGKDEHLQMQAAQINRQMYQMLRCICNMNHATECTLPGLMESTQICSFLQEILDKAAAQTPLIHSRLTYELPNEAIFTHVNRDNLERAVLHLVSNALKHAPEGSPVQLRMVKKHQRLYCSVINTLSDPEHWVPPHNCFLRQPGLEDPSKGIGLGMLLLQHVAAEHGGALLVERVDDSVRFTITLPITRSGNTQVRSPMHAFDYAGEHDHCLVELSDVLPAEVYKPENLK